MEDYGVFSKGICRLSMVPVRAVASDQSELVTQLLFGDHYTVTDISENKKWLRIKIYFDDYEGWIDSKQHCNIHEDYFDQINNSDFKITLDYTTGILYKKQLITIVIGSVLPIATNELFKMEEQLAFNGEAKGLNLKRDFEFMKNIAFRYINAPYLWGGKSPFGIDCSGFTQQVFKICGYKLERDARAQVMQGEQVSDISNAKPGDLVFFKNKEGRINHVGIFLGQNEVIHASGKVRVDRIDEEGIVNVENEKYSHQLTTIRRILK